MSTNQETAAELRAMADKLDPPAAKPEPRMMRGGKVPPGDYLAGAAHGAPHLENHACGLYGCIPEPKEASPEPDAMQKLGKLLSGMSQDEIRDFARKFNELTPEEIAVKYSEAQEAQANHIGGINEKVLDASSTSSPEPVKPRRWECVEIPYENLDQDELRVTEPYGTKTSQNHYTVKVRELPAVETGLEFSDSKLDRLREIFWKEYYGNLNSPSETLAHADRSALRAVLREVRVGRKITAAEFDTFISNCTSAGTETSNVRIRVWARRAFREIGFEVEGEA